MDHDCIDMFRHFAAFARGRQRGREGKAGNDVVQDPGVIYWARIVAHSSPLMNHCMTLCYEPRWGRAARLDGGRYSREELNHESEKLHSSRNEMLSWVVLRSFLGPSAHLNCVSKRRAAWLVKASVGMGDKQVVVL